MSKILLPIIRPILTPLFGSTLSSDSDIGVGEPPTLESILAKAGPQSGHWDLRTTATLFQPVNVEDPEFDPATDLVPITASGQPLGVALDQLHELSSGNHLYTSPTKAPEYWIDPFTSEPCTWYNTTVETPMYWGPLLGVGCTGVTGTICIAYTTGAQVFNLTASDAIPPGPMIAAYFFDFVLSNAEATVMKAHMDAIVADDSWLGYVIGTSYTDTITVASAGVQIHFSVDPTHDSDEWPDGGGLFASLTLSEARQRFKITVADPSEFNPGNVFHPDLGEGFVLDLFANETWTKDLYDDVAERVNGWKVSKGVYGEGNPAEYGALAICQRANPNPIVQLLVSDHNPSFAVLPYLLHSHPLGYSYTFTSALRRAYVYEIGADIEVFSNGPAPNFNACVNLKSITFIVENVTGLLPTIGPALKYYGMAGYVDPQPCPVLPSTLGSVSMYYCNLTTMPDYSAMSGASYLYFSGNQLSGVVPSLTAATTGVPLNANNARYMFDNNSGITGYAGGQIAPVAPDQYALAGIQVRFNGCSLDQASVDAVLKACLDMGYDRNDGAICRCYLHQGTNSAPSALGLTYKSSLQALGWTVQHN